MDDKDDKIIDLSSDDSSGELNTTQAYAQPFK